MVPNQNKKTICPRAVNPKLPRLIGETLMKWLARTKLTETEFDSLCFPIRLFDLFVLFHRAGFLSAASRRVKEFRSNRLKTIAGLRGIGKKMLKKCDGIPLCHVYWYYYSECILLAPANSAWTARVLCNSCLNIGSRGWAQLSGGNAANCQHWATLNISEPPWIYCWQQILFGKRRPPLQSYFNLHQAWWMHASTSRFCMQHLFLKKEPGGKGEDDDDVRMFIKPKKNQDVDWVVSNEDDMWSTAMMCAEKKLETKVTQWKSVG